MPKYTLFRHKNRQDLRCVVSADQPLPASLEAEMWDDGGTVFDESSAPPGFQEGAARFALAVQGFYIFRQRTPIQAFAQRTAAAYPV